MKGSKKQDGNHENQQAIRYSQKFSGIFLKITMTTNKNARNKQKICIDGGKYQRINLPDQTQMKQKLMNLKTNLKILPYYSTQRKNNRK